MTWEKLTWGLLALSVLLGPLLVDPLASEPLGPIKTIASLLLPFMALISAMASRGAGVWQGSFQKVLGLVMAVAAICALRSQSWPLASEELLRLAGLACAAWAAAACTWSPRRCLYFCSFIVLGALVNGALALAEHYNLPWKLYGQQDRLVALFGHQNVLAQYLVIPVMMLMAWPGSPITSRILTSLLTGLLGLTLCRGAWAAVLGGTMVMAFLSKGKLGLGRILWPVVGGVAIGILVNAWAAPDPSSGAPFTYKRDARILTGDSNRLNYYSQGSELILEKPVLGWGLGQFPVVYQKIDVARNEFVRYLHCDYLQWGVETGLIGLMTLFSLGWVVLGMIRRAPVHLIPLAFALTGVLAHCLVEYSMQMSVTSVLTAICAGALASPGTPAVTLMPTRSRLWPLGGLCALALIIPSIHSPIQASRLEKNAITLGAEDTMEGLAILDKALELTPHDPTLLWNVSCSQDQAGLDQRAVETLERLRSLTPWNERVHLLLADVHEQMGNTQAMAVSLERAREVLPRSRALLIALAILHTRQGRHADRDSALSVLRTMDDWNDINREFIGRLDRTKDPASLAHAEAYLQDLVDRGSREPRLRIKLAAILFRLRKFEPALTHYRSLLSRDRGLFAQLEPRELEALHIAAGNTARQAGHESEAVEYFEAGMRAFPSSRSLFTLVFQQILDKEGIMDAMEQLEQTISNGANEIEFRRLAADTLEKWSEGPTVEQEVQRQRQMADHLESLK